MDVRNGRMAGIQVGEIAGARISLREKVLLLQMPGRKKSLSGGRSGPMQGPNGGTDSMHLPAF
jgi:hypothetical protein